VTLGCDKAPLLPLRGRSNIQTWVFTSLTGSGPLPGSCISLGSVVCPRPSTFLSGRMSPSSVSNCPLASGGITSLGSLGDAQGDKGVKSTISTILDEPLEMLWETQTETWDTETRKQCFIVLAQTQWTQVQRLSPKSKGISPYVLLQAGYRGKQTNKQSLTHIQLYAII
jgi:hypothetical protein